MIDVELSHTAIAKLSNLGSDGSPIHTIKSELNLSIISKVHEDPIDLKFLHDTIKWMHDDDEVLWGL
ncbi:hypothetical protein DERP_000071 [Dermatophagoides pteronyssinus]|uniref:Uncharacterized protein n=1 Tax=Dermatophagoides pteronyssinus TaxID=6956 RepID=A0ABQ8IZ83_DERPT|nr:hypothetical protein DERP_000071 [Dermatophagoides pteronyssinus]